MIKLLVCTSFGFLGCALHAFKRHQPRRALTMIGTFATSVLYHSTHQKVYKVIDMTWVHAQSIYAFISSIKTKNIVSTLCIAFIGGVFWGSHSTLSDVHHALYVHLPAMICYISIVEHHKKR